MRTAPPAPSRSSGRVRRDARACEALADVGLGYDRARSPRRNEERLQVVAARACARSERWAVDSSPASVFVMKSPGPSSDDVANQHQTLVREMGRSRRLDEHAAGFAVAKQRLAVR